MRARGSESDGQSVECDAGESMLRRRRGLLLPLNRHRFRGGGRRGSHGPCRQGCCEEQEQGHDFCHGTLRRRTAERTEAKGESCARQGAPWKYLCFATMRVELS